jgi:hypothetical protein
MGAYLIFPGNYNKIFRELFSGNLIPDYYLDLTHDRLELIPNYYLPHP